MPDLVFRDDAKNKRVPVKLWCVPGHFYSPIPDTEQLSEPRYRDRIWPAEPHPMPGIDWRAEAQLELCETVFGAQKPIEFPVESSPDVVEYTRSSPRYRALDAWVLQAFLRHLKPARVIEVGSGHSSLVTARVNREFLDESMRFTAIDPAPLPFLQGVPGISELRAEEVQETPLELFEELGANDLLFIDTSHTVKTGGDVPWIYNQILPRLASGVVVHLHDAFLPYDYPPEWVFAGRSWNELYLMQSFLVGNTAFEVLFGTYWMTRAHWDVLGRTFPGLDDEDRDGSSSLWIRRV
jgi:hypothetical protein